MKILKQNCPNCGAKDGQTIESGIERTGTEYSYIRIDCKKCKKWAIRSNSSQSNEPLSGSWSRHARQELETYSKDTLQPLDKHGNVNRKFIQAHGTQSLEKEYKMTKQEVLEQAEKYGN